MKVVLFCGGMGMRLREYSDVVPKPLVPVGERPILWHLMKYYAHYGHTDFILCVGFRAEVIKNYFLEYDERLSNDFVLRKGGSDIQLLGSDIDDWSITFVASGLKANVGMRLMAAREHLEGESTFLANYADGLTDLRLDDYVDHFERHGKVASMLSVAAPHTFHLIDADEQGNVRKVEPSHSRLRTNGGFFAFRSEIFDYIQPGEDLVVEPFQRLIDDQQLVAYRHDGFWMSMDTFKDKTLFEDRVLAGDTPWQVWNHEKGDV